MAIDDVCKYRWLLKHGSLVLGALAGINGAAFTSHFRRRMLIRHQARMASYIPSVVIPCVTTALAQHSLTFDRLLGMKSQCLLCSEIGAMSVQVKNVIGLFRVK